METATAEKRELKIVREPRVYLVGRQVVSDEAISRFLADEGRTWQTDTEVGAEKLAEIAGRVCYMSYGKGRKTNAEFLAHLVEVGHGSVLEHGVWSFLVTGVSRSFTHELIRHRHFSYSQLSQRYVDESESEFVEPDVIATDPELHAAWSEAVNAARARLRPPGDGAGGQVHRHRRQDAAPQDGAAGGALGAAERHRDQDLHHRQRARAAAFHRAARQRARRRRDPQGRGRGAAHHAEGIAEHVPGLHARAACRRFARDAHGARRRSEARVSRGDVQRRPVTRVTGRSSERFEDALAVERALEMRVDGRSLAVTLRTPGHDEDLVLGFLASEALVTRRRRRGGDCGARGRAAPTSPTWRRSRSRRA